MSATRKQHSPPNPTPNPETSASSQAPPPAKKMKTITTLSRKSMTRKPTNNSDEGVDFERLLRVSTFLTLQGDQEMNCEMDEAGNFDDVIVFDPENGFYLRQVKHKQTKQDGPPFEIGENDIFSSSLSGMFCLDKYVKSFLTKICRAKPKDKFIKY